MDFLSQHVCSLLVRYVPLDVCRVITRLLRRTVNDVYEIPDHLQVSHVDDMCSQIHRWFPEIRIGDILQSPSCHGEQPLRRYVHVRGGFISIPHVSCSLQHFLGEPELPLDFWGPQPQVIRLDENSLKQSQLQVISVERPDFVVLLPSTVNQRALRLHCGIAAHARFVTNRLQSPGGVVTVLHLLRTRLRDRLLFVRAETKRYLGAYRGGFSNHYHTIRACAKDQPCHEASRFHSVTCAQTRKKILEALRSFFLADNCLIIILSQRR